MNARIARIAALLGTAACLTVSPARAVVPVSVTFDIHWTQGLLMGTQSSGTFSYDFSALTGVGPGTEELGDTTGLLSLSIQVSGKTFTKADDNDPLYPDYPKVFFVSDVFNGFDYFSIVDNDYLLGLFELGAGKGIMGRGAYFTDLAGESFGDISFRPYTFPDRNPPPVNNVPEGGATVVLLAGAFCALAAAKRCHRTNLTM